MGDCHIGAHRRNKWMYNKVFEVWCDTLDMISEIYSETGLVIAGDLWDSETPRPLDFIEVKNGLYKYMDCNNTNKSVFVIPGNHDRICIDGACAANVLTDMADDGNISVITEMRTVESSNGKIMFHFLPYTSDMIEILKEWVTNGGNFEDNHKHVLIGHFSLIEANSYAGIISEANPVFENFDMVVLGDTHMCYDHGKFHTTGTLYFNNVDEMASKTCIPSFLVIDETDCTVERKKINRLKPIIISNEEEAEDPERLYLIVSNEPLTITKSNVFVKYKLDDIIAESLKIDESVIIANGIDKNQFFEITYPDMDPKRRGLLKDYESGRIELDEMISGNQKEASNSTIIASEDNDAVIRSLEDLF